MVWAALAACALSAVLSSEAAVNYCGAAMCGKTDAHTFCQFPEGPSRLCSGYIDDRLTGEEKARVVARMNRRRSEVAQGRMQHLPPAGNMLRLRWVEELAREAQIWADQCQPPSSPEHHDGCRDLYAITVGQCVASVVGEAPGLRPESVVDMWFLQGRQYRGTVFVDPEDNKNSAPDFEQMMWAHTYLVGCARSRFMTEQNGRLRTVTRLVCNFAPRGPVGPLWTPGVPAAACPPRARPDPELPGLCTFHHDATFAYDVTNTTIVKDQSVLDTIMEIERNDSLNFHGSLDQIYLTKIVVANMRNEAANNSYSMEEKDVEPILSETETLLNSSDGDKNVIDEIIAETLKKISTERISKKKISTIGRPKSYNIEELSLADNDSENGTARPDEADKEDDPYRDYEFDKYSDINDMYYNSSITESNVTTESEKLSENMTKVITATGRPTYIMEPNEATTNSSNGEMRNVTLITDANDNTTSPIVQNDILKRLIELSKQAEQNPSNPETARQLQEALDQMEHALASPVPKKVRRELRSQSDDRGDKMQSSRAPVPEEESYKPKLKNIGVPDSVPIMTILAKYAPFMQKYENFFSRNAASNTTLSLVLFVLGWIVSNII